MAVKNVLKKGNENGICESDRIGYNIKIVGDCILKYLRYVIKSPGNEVTL